MKCSDQQSTILSSLRRQWAMARFKAGFGPPPWHREKLVDTIDLGYRLMADVRVFQNESGGECFLIDLMDKQDDYSTVALLQCCDITAVVSILLESDLVIQRYKNSVPIEEWADD